MSSDFALGMAIERTSMKLDHVHDRLDDIHHRLDDLVERLEELPDEVYAKIPTPASSAPVPAATVAPQGLLPSTRADWIRVVAAALMLLGAWGLFTNKLTLSDATKEYKGVRELLK
jgi:hypothetical protein